MINCKLQVPVIIDNRVGYWSVTKTFYEKLVTQVQTQVLLDNQRKKAKAFKRSRIKVRLHRK